MEQESAIALGVAVAVFGPLGAVAVLEPLAWPGSTALVVAVLLVVVANATALGGATIGLFAAVVATLSYDFVLVPPSGELTLALGDHRGPVLALAGAGLAVAAAGRRESRTHQDAPRRRGDGVASGSWPR